MENRTTIKKSKIMRNVTASILLVILLAASLTGATYAWFISNASTSENVFIAGTVELSKPDVESSSTILDQTGSNFAFVPNSGEASVSKVDLANRIEVARYSTIPTRPGPYELQDYRVARLAIDSGGNAWALNTMTGSGFTYDSAQGSVARINANEVPGEVPGTTTSNTGGIGGLVLPDERVSFFNLGSAGDGPRTINVVEEDGEIYIWVGFHLGKYFQKYWYDSTNNNLVKIDGAYINVDPFTPYYAAIDSNGIMWVTSRNANPYPTQGTSAVFNFNTNNLSAGTNTMIYNLPNSSDNNPYAIIVARDGKVWVSDGGNWTENRVRHFAVYTPGNTEPVYVPSGSSQSIRGFIEYQGNIWATTINGLVLKGVPSNGAWNFSTAISGLGELAGIGPDSFGNLWVIQLGLHQIYRFNPDNLGVGHSTIAVGQNPYAYDSFIRPGKTCKTVEWEFENVGTKGVYVRVKPVAHLNGSPVTINLHENNENWQKGSDDWWYYGSASAPHEVYPNPDANSKVSVVFEYCFENITNPNLTVTLEVEAVQRSNNAIDNEWVLHPWVD